MLIFLAGYLFIFYASAIDKAFFLDEEEITSQINENTYSTGIRALVDPQALRKAYQNGNYLVLFGPVLFIAFALAVDLLWRPKRRWASITFAILTLGLDLLLAIHISQKIHLAETEIQIWKPGNPNIEEWTLFGLDTIFEVSTVIFFGFVASLLASILHHVTREQWEQVETLHSKSKEDLRHEIYREAEKMKREARNAMVKTKIGNLTKEINQLKKKIAATEQKIDECQTKIEAFFRQQQEAEIRELRLPVETQIAVLNTEIDNLQNEIERLTEKMATTHQKIDQVSQQQRIAEIETIRLPIETQIAVLNTEIDNLQNEITQLTEKSTALQKKTKAKEEKIEALLDQRNERVISLSKMQSQVNQFLNGWFRFIAHSTDKGTDVSNQIDEIKQIAEDTLEQYYQNLPDYLFQP